MEHAVVIANPHAGRGAKFDPTILQPVAHALGWDLELIVPPHAGATVAAAQAAVDAGATRILAAGGDGTINCIARVLAGTPVQLGVIPLGTANVMALELGIPIDPVLALRIALHGEVRAVDIGRANERLFVLNAGLGFDAQVVTELVPRWKQLFGTMAYVATGLQVLTSFPRVTFHLVLPECDVRVPAWLLVVGNAGYYAYQISLAPEARMDDGLLDLCLFAETSVLDRITEISATLLGQQTHHPLVSYIRVRTVRILADPPVPLQLDGDPAGTTPVDISIWPRALHVVAPPT